MLTLAVICPVYKEEDGILQFNEELLKVLSDESYRVSGRIIYVVDPSMDKTEELLISIANKNDLVSVIVFSRRFGHQAALLAGMDYSDDDIIVMMDSDFQHPPKFIPAMLDENENGAEIVQMLRVDGKNIGFFKRVTSRLFYRLLSRLAGVKFQQGAADFRLISRRVARLFKTEIRERNQFLRGLFMWVGFNVQFVRFECPPRRYGRSKYLLSTMINLATNGICSFSKAPLRFTILLGLLFFFLGAFFSVSQIIIYIMDSNKVSGWASLVSMITLFGGLQIALIGILGEYISLIFDEVKSRPHYIVETYIK